LSVESIVGGAIMNRSSNNSLLSAIEKLNEAALIEDIKRVQPFIFLKSNNNNLSSNVADGVVILSGPQIPSGTKAIVEDFNVNFTTAAGTVRLVILDGSNRIITDILRDINSSTNGTGKTVLEEGQRLGIVGQSPGAGTFSVYCSGILQVTRPEDFF
jgi:hypothetical protein